MPHKSHLQVQWWVDSRVDENSFYLSLFVQQKDNLNAIGHSVGRDSETKSTEHCPKYKQSTVI